MKYVLIFLIGLFTYTLSNAQENRKPEIGFKTGVNLSTFSTPNNNSKNSIRLGFHLGLYVKAPLWRSFFFRPELCYSSQGQQNNYQSTPGGPSVGNTTTIANYLNAPLLLDWGKKVSVQFGPQFGFPLSGKEVGTINGVKINDDIKPYMHSPDVSMITGIATNPNKHVQLGARYQFGLTNIFPPQIGGPAPGVKNRVIHIFVGYSF